MVSSTHCGQAGKITLGTRSILDYVLSPVQKTWHESGRER
jgi:HlyD family secretion protein